MSSITILQGPGSSAKCPRLRESWVSHQGLKTTCERTLKGFGPLARPVFNCFSVRSMISRGVANLSAGTGLRSWLVNLECPASLLGFAPGTALRHVSKLAGTIRPHRTPPRPPSQSFSCAGLLASCLISQFRVAVVKLRGFVSILIMMMPDPVAECREPRMRPLATNRKPGLSARHSILMRTPTLSGG